MKACHPRAARFRGSRYLSFRCTDCGNCCCDTLVPISHEDVLRIMQGTGFKAREICAFYRPEDFQGGVDGLEFANLEGGRKTLGLRKRFDKENDREACRFFDGHHCSIYLHRPVTCRVWPFTLAFDATGRRVTSLSINDALPCPYELDGVNALPKMVADWRWDDRQDAAWAAKVGEWNRTRTTGTEDEFLAFLGLA